MTEKKVPSELEEGRIGKLLSRYAFPAIIAMTASSLYNIIDSIFIGRGVGPFAISGLALTFPLMNLAAAFGSLVGVGASALLSIKLGEKDYWTSQRILGNVVVLNVIFGTAFSLLTIPFLDPILYFFGASDQTIPYARDYMEVILAGNVVTHLYLGLNSLLRSAGHPRTAMYATISTVVFNVVLDYLFIYVLGWGIRGAAWATVISQMLALLWLVKRFSDKKELVHFHRGIFRLKRKIVFDSLSIGLSPFIMNALSSFIVILINWGMGEYGGDLSIGAYGIVNRISFMVVMVVIGLNQGMQPIAGYNYGAGLYPRVLRVFKLTALWATAITTAGFLAGEIFPRPIVSIFTSDADLIERSAYGLRVLVLAFPLVGFQMTSVTLFQSIGKAWKAVFFSLTRQFIFLIPALLIFPSLWGISGVWYSIPVSDSVSSILAAVMAWMQLRQLRRLEAARRLGA